ncbi:hypothetical protein [Kitasatospora sp. NPDC057223]|uniref:hypothetical protein n=1 Tax=Kitasatospora sp. NPDC057223 TaxID=3346055 RepID=UPI003630DC25
MSVTAFSRASSRARVLALLPVPRAGTESAAYLGLLPQSSSPVPAIVAGPVPDADPPLFAELADLWEAFGRSVPTRPDPQWDALVQPPCTGRLRG